MKSFGGRLFSPMTISRPLGDPAYDATQHLFNCETRLLADPQGTIGRFAGLLGVDRERVRLWMFARAAAEPRDDWRNAGRASLARALRPSESIRP